MLARKTSYNQLTQNSLASIPDSSAGYGVRQAARSGDVEVGDLVNTPGGMHGIVKFIGNVKGKGGVFVGVELEGELAGRGKNDGAVDGVRYFTTAQPQSGIFVPLARASKRNSVDSSQAPPTPTFLDSPSTLAPPAITPNRVRSESPAGRAFSSAMKTPGSGRPSLSGRPESPVRRMNTPGPLGGPSRPSLLPPSTPRAGSAMGTRIGALSPTPAIGRPNFQGRARAGSVAGSIAGDYQNSRTPTISTPKPPKTPTSQLHTLKQPKSNLALRSGSSIGFSRPGSSLDRHMEEEEPMPTPYHNHHHHHHQNYSSSPIDSGIGMARSEEMDGIIAALKVELSDKDRQLQGQAASLLEMEASLVELQNLMNGGMMSPRSNTFEDADASQLRALLREKNEKIAHLTAEFDAHRADFRSTIDTLELASSETERVYEKRVADLMEDIRELQDRNEDVDSVARQLKQLEELVAELEEGLEDARRGEAEARGEVEFLRGEVERSREELRREREKSAAAVANAAVGKMMRNGQDEVEKKDDEIRGLKAIIHSLSRDSVALEDTAAPTHPKVNGGAELVKERQNGEKLSHEITQLQNQIKNKVNREEELEREIEELRKKREARTSASSEKTVSAWGGRVVSGGSAERIGWRNRQLSGSGNSLRKLQLDTTPIKEASISEGKDSSELTPIDSDADSTVPWCEICETGGHDILTCTSMFGSGAGGPASAGPNGSTTAAAAAAAEQEEHTPSSSPLPPLRRKDPPASSPAPPTTVSSATTEDDFSVDTPIAEKKKSVHLPHLPPPPPIVDTGSSFGPLAGKDSGTVDMDKWCALCERDGHDSVDCPEETDY
ncbi:hypothetical protein BZA05DRAFT_343084 [Tricharina praecox]|uniref:uncharacterized protein n=1 Tax=Tricharina praecox TaxID=43433 RepID=UPI0022209E0A|nr:uncharacterized protein BZA05DRAFT_343084 [Tricharina praecox]KAI5844290.1 hypothetical protein BZA05DRAFT_343084 [Tricharina praecox]